MIEWLSILIAMLAAGVVGGLLAGLLGVGGGIVIVPVLEAALGLIGVDPAVRMHVAVATSLATIIPTSIASTRAHFRRESVDTALARKWAPWIFLGALAGTWVASALEGHVLSGIFGLLALLVALKMILPLDRYAPGRGVPTGIGGSPIPVSIGFFSSMMGIGGGSLSVPVLTLFGKPIHRAVGTSALFGLLIAVPGTLGFMITGFGHELLPPASIGYVNLAGLLVVASTTVIAAPLGARLAHSASRRSLTIMFGLFLLLISARMLMRAFAG